MVIKWLRCKLTPGMFSDEYVVSASTYSGRPFSLFAHQRVVQSEGVPTHQHPVDGWLQVTEIGNEGPSAVVVLPSEPLEMNPRVCVPSSQLAPTIPHQ